MKEYDVPVLNAISGMLITIGKVLKPFGLKGEMKIESLTDFPERFKELGRVSLVSPAGKELACTVTSVRYANDVPFLTFSGYDSPEKAKTLNGWFVKVPREEVVPLQEGSYYWFELIGMEVFSEEGETLGTITDIFETGSNDVYVMKRGGQEVYLPATREIIKQVDVAAKKMVIHIVDGLME
jgi:16S rRNA processing protein RimM